ncbi:MAG: DMT family transporter [Lachnospiraceae bacterium]|nr:DMT family transporter [Lachnospiraceae bacterium]
MFRKNKSSHIWNVLALITASVIWGTAFVSQSTGGDIMGPYSFNCIRSFIATLVLLIVIKVLDMLKLSGKKPETKEEKKLLWIGGILCGTALCIASNLQQVAINMGTETGKAGFLTAIYILIIPILSIFLKKMCSWNVWVGVAIALFGMYLLCAVESWNLKTADLLLIACAFMFAIQILCIDYFAPKVDNVRLSCIQFLTTAVLTIIPMVWFDWGHSFEGFINWSPALTNKSAWGSLLFAAVFSSGIAYTLQIIGQNNFNPTIASMLMSLESVFSVLAGFVFLNQTLSVNELFGCLLIFTAIIFAQLPIAGKKSKANET